MSKEHLMNKYYFFFESKLLELLERQTNLNRASQYGFFSQYLN